MSNTNATRKRSIRLAAAGITLSLALVGTVVAYAATDHGSVSIDEARTIDSPQATADRAGNSVPHEILTLKGEVGTVIKDGDLIYTRVADDSEPFKSSTIASLQNTLSGQQLSTPFMLTQENRYYQLWIKNTGQGHIILSLSADSPMGSTMSGGVAKLTAHSTWMISNLKPWAAGTYYVSFTSGSYLMSGQAVYTIADKPISE